MINQKKKSALKIIAIILIYVFNAVSIVCLTIGRACDCLFKLFAYDYIASIDNSIFYSPESWAWFNIIYVPVSFVIITIYYIVSIKKLKEVGLTKKYLVCNVAFTVIFLIVQLVVFEFFC